MLHNFGYPTAPLDFNHPRPTILSSTSIDHTYLIGGERRGIVEVCTRRSRFDDWNSSWSTTGYIMTHEDFTHLFPFVLGPMGRRQAWKPATHIFGWSLNLGMVFQAADTMINGRRSMINGRRSMINGRRSMINGRQSMINGFIGARLKWTIPEPVRRTQELRRPNRPREKHGVLEFVTKLQFSRR